MRNVIKIRLRTFGGSCPTTVRSDERSTQSGDSPVRGRFTSWLRLNI